MDNSTGGQTFMERYMTPIAVLLGAAIIAFALAYGHSAITPTTQTQGTNGQPAQMAVDITKVKTDNDPFIGSATAPVTMALWFDYQCPFCKKFDSEVVSQLYTNYVQTGKLRIVFKDFPFLGNDSISGGEFARAVWELYPDQFYAWYQAMFVAQDEEGDQGFGNLPSIDAMTKAKVPGIDVAKVEALITQKKTQYDAALQADRAEGVSFGVNGTPAVIIGTTLLSGAQPYSTIAPLIDAQLNK